MFKKLVGLLTVTVTGLLLSATASAAIDGSAHDLALALGGSSTGEICVVCHAPHGNRNDSGDLLWNRDATDTTFIPYDSPTLDQAATLPGATSMLCLGCHDGTIAVDNYGAETTGTAAYTINGTAFGGLDKFLPDLGQDHPIGVAYSTANGTNFDSELNPIGDAFGTTTISAMLQEFKVECATCHDVHNTISEGNPKLLVETNAGSDLCLACHNK
jgi:predicted CXXCH cytochrome family protein